MGLARKKVTVRSKSGKVYQRSMLVRAGDTVRRVAGKVKGFAKKHPVAAKVGAVALASLAAHAYHNRRAIRDKAVMAGSHVIETAWRARDATHRAGTAARQWLRIPKVYVRNGKTHVERDWKRAK